MKQKLLLFSFLIIGLIIFMGQKNDDSPRLNVNPRSVVNLSGEYIPLPIQTNDTYQFSNSPRTNFTPIGVLTTFPNVRVRPSTVVQQTECPIVSSPLNRMVLFGSSNAASGSFINSGVYVSTDGGVTWRGSDTVNAPNLNDQRGDPGPTIDKNGTFILTHLTSNSTFGGVTGMGANYSTNNGITWSATVQVANDPNADKNFAGTDDSPASPFYGNSYMAWTSFMGLLGNGRASRTTNGGVNWSAPIILNATPAGHFAQGHDVAVGPNGDVYIVWTAGVSSTPFTEDFVGVAKSTDGGITYTATENAYDVNGSRSFSFNGWGIRMFGGFPRIAIDKSGGSRNGWIYVVTGETNLLPAGSDADVILHRSSNNGVNWSPGIRVNQDPLNNGKVQFFPAICVDDAGGVNVVYYDNRNFPSFGDSATVFISRSIDGGTTWTDVEVADHHFKPKPSSAFGGGYMGDYIGITASVGKVVAIWMDDKAGVPGFYNAWTGAIQTVVYPLNAFSLRTPPAATRLVSFPNSSTQYTFTWDTSASTASYKWVFGNPTVPPRRITLPIIGNSLTITAGQLDNILAGLGLAQGDSLVGQWDVWAFKNSSPDDSLKASNGPRSLILRRGVPALTAFNLSAPPSGTTITTSVFNTSTINLNWTRSGQGVTYRWKFGSPAISNIRLSMPSNSSGFDTVLTITNSNLDGILQGIGLNPGDSLVGQWAVWAYNANDSVKSTQNFALTLKRQSRGDVIVVYDSTLTLGRVSRDSVINNLSSLGASFDLFNRGSNTATLAISFRGYNKVIVLGEGTSVMSNSLKDSLKSYLAAGTTTKKSKLIVMAEDVGYHLDRSVSTFLDTAFARSTLGFQYVADRPAAVSNYGLIGVTINPNVADSCAGFWPDVLRKSTSVPQSQLYNLYRFRLYPDSMNAIGRISPTYNVASLGIDIESLRPTTDSPPGSPVRRFVKGAMDFVDEVITSVTNNTGLIPTEYSLTQNYPNPFNPATKINFSLPKQGITTLKLYDVLGKEVMTLVNELKAAGIYEIHFNASNLASGAYFYRIESGDFKDIKRMMLIK